MTLTIDIDELERRCTQRKNTLLWGEPGFTPWHVNKDYFAYKNTGGKVLAVAHVDVAVSGYHHLFESWPGLGVNTPALDDRLGVHVILDILPRLLSEPIDVLLTDDEEIGRSTAQHFTKLAGTKEYETLPPYNWIFSFDRRMTDVVMYGYHDYETSKLLTDHGFDVGRGSFSDIAYLYDLGVKGFNFGVGYDNEHTMQCSAFFEDTIMMVEKFAAFFEAMKDTHLPHDNTTTYNRWSRTYDDYDYKWNGSGRTTWDSSGKNKWNGSGSGKTKWIESDVQCDMCQMHFSEWSIFYIHRYEADLCRECMELLDLDVGHYESIGRERYNSTV